MNRAIDSLDTLRKEVMVWTDEDNKQSAEVRWSFTVHEAREKLASQYEKMSAANFKSDTKLDKY